MPVYLSLETIRGMKFEELYQCGCLALCRAAATYDHSKAFDAVDDTVLAGELTKLLDEAKMAYKGAVLKGIEAIELQLKGYSGAEIARMYGVKNNNVTSWISKARAALRKEWLGAPA